MATMEETTQAEPSLVDIYLLLDAIIYGSLPAEDVRARIVELAEERHETYSQVRSNLLSRLELQRNKGVYVQGKIDAISPQVRQMLGLNGEF